MSDYEVHTDLLRPLLTPADNLPPVRRRETSQALLDLLLPGRENVQSSHVLADRLHCNQRMIGSLVNDLRMNGCLVGSVHGEGYYLIVTREELEATIEHIEIRVGGIRRTTQALRDSWSAR